MSVEDILSGYETLETPFYEDQIGWDVMRSGATDLESQSEFAVFNLHIACDDNNKWGTYYNSSFLRISDSEDVNLRLVTKEMIEHWQTRAKTAKHPILVARYTDAVWDLKKIVTGENPDPEYARIAIDNNILIAERSLHKYPVVVLDRLERALRLAISLRDQTRISAVKNTLLSFEAKIAEDDKMGTWGRTCDLLVLELKSLTNENEKTSILEALENRISRLLAKGENTNPWAVEAAASRIARYYRSKNDLAKVQLALLNIEKAFDKLKQSSNPLQISGWYQHLHSIYIQFQLHEDANRIAGMLPEIGRQARESLSAMSHTFEIPAEAIDQHIDRITKGDLEEAIGNLVFYHKPEKEKIRQQIVELASDFPMSFLMTKVLMDNAGITTATIGSIDSDVDGNIIFQMTQNMAFDSIILRKSIDEICKKYQVTPETLCDLIFTCPLFREDRRTLVLQGITAYMNSDFVQAIHILVPQTEAAFRKLIELSGGNVLKPDRSGGFQLKTLHEVLSDPIITKTFAQDFDLYFKTILTDPRGLNIRNTVSHGLVESESFNQQTADRIFHILLALSLVKKKKADNPPEGAQE